MRSTNQMDDKAYRREIGKIWSGRRIRQYLGLAAGILVSLNFPMQAYRNVAIPPIETSQTQRYEGAAELSKKLQDLDFSENIPGSNRLIAARNDLEDFLERESASAPIKHYLKTKKDYEDTKSSNFWTYTIGGIFAPFLWLGGYIYGTGFANSYEDRKRKQLQRKMDESRENEE